MNGVSRVRLDKWLWSVRLYKSRTMASDACRAGKVRLNELTAKPSVLIVRGDMVQLKKNGFNLSYRVMELIDKRVSATLAAPCIEDLTPQEELSKYKEWYVGKSGVEFREKGDGRPTKKERREIDDFKSLYLELDDMIDI
jgi:ribosome-associated heat shock protein Hsp15